MKQGFGLGVTLAWLFVAVFAYVLSVGPAIRVFERIENPLAQRAFEILYTPLGWLTDTLRDPIDWYIGLWIDHMPPSPLL